MVKSMRNIKKNNLDKYIGETIQLKIPSTKYSTWRWIIRKRQDGRYIVRHPKIGVKIKDLNIHNISDYGEETLLPKGATVFGNPRRKTRKNKKSF
jgi:hypothetical protein